VDLIKNKEHLTLVGLDKLTKISTGMNSYRLYIPNYAIQDKFEYVPLNGYYINGFIAGDGCLALNTKYKNFAKMSIQISQHKNNKGLLFSIANYFKSSNKIYFHDINSIQLTLSGIKF